MMMIDDHACDRALTCFCQMIAIHGLTIIAHHCSILIMMRLLGNGKPGLEALCGGAGTPRGKSIKRGKSGWEEDAHGLRWRHFLESIPRDRLDRIPCHGAEGAD
jgi:hypothetical protein